MALTDKQKRFCEEYLLDLNATQAAIRAGYSKKTANRIASENLTKPDIQDYIAKSKERLANKLQITQELILEGYRRLAFYDPRRFYDGNGNLLPVNSLDEETAFALTGFEVMEEKGGDGLGHQVFLGYTKKIKMSDRRGALDSICRLLGYNSPDKIAQTDKAGNDIEHPKPYSKEDLIEILKEANG